MMKNKLPVDTSPLYLRKCEMAWDLQVLKRREGFNEGDVVYLPSEKKFCVVGHDFLGVNQFKIYGDRIHVPVFACSRQQLLYQTKGNTIDIKVCIKDVEYRLRSLYCVIWLPTLSQLIEMILKSDPRLNKKVFNLDRLAHFLMFFREYFYTYLCETLEQTALHYLMAVKFKKVWDKEDQRWIAIEEDDP